LCNKKLIVLIVLYTYYTLIQTVHLTLVDAAILENGSEISECIYLCSTLCALL